MIVLNGGHPDDEDYGEAIVYTGHGAGSRETPLRAWSADLAPSYSLFVPKHGRSKVNTPLLRLCVPVCWEVALYGGACCTPGTEDRKRGTSVDRPGHAHASSA